jgi:hypothetical protein
MTLQSNGCGVAISFAWIWFELYRLWIWFGLNRLPKGPKESTGTIDLGGGGGCTHGDGVWRILIKPLLDGSVHCLPKAIKSFVNAGKSFVHHDENEGMLFNEGELKTCSLY